VWDATRNTIVKQWPCSLFTYGEQVQMFKVSVFHPVWRILILQMQLEKDNTLVYKPVSNIDGTGAV
jgi:regulatory protein YycI of two-component signal transduction system YycFG